jgi:hypothetical protein
LPEAVAPFATANVKDTVVEEVGGYDDIIASDIWELVTFPLIPRSTVAPVPFVARTVLCEWVGDGVALGVGVAPGLGVGVAVGFEVPVEIGVAVG